MLPERERAARAQEARALTETENKSPGFAQADGDSGRAGGRRRPGSGDAVFWKRLRGAVSEKDVLDNKKGSRTWNKARARARHRLGRRRTCDRRRAYQPSKATKRELGESKDVLAHQEVGGVAVWLQDDDGART